MAIVEYEAPNQSITEREQRARTLEAAALEIEVRGWCQGIARDGDGRLCAVGAVKTVLGYDALSVFTYESAAALDHAWGNGDWKGMALPIFNDYRAGSAKEVTFLLRWRASEIRDGWDH